MATEYMNPFIFLEFFTLQLLYKIHNYPVIIRRKSNDYEKIQLCYFIFLQSLNFHRTVVG